MKKHIHSYFAVIVLPFLLFVSTPAVHAGSVQDDIFLENTYEDYTLSSGKFWADTHQKSEFSALETGQKISDTDIFLERDYEDYTLD